MLQNESKHIKKFKMVHLLPHEVIHFGAPAFLRITGHDKFIDRKTIDWLLNRGYIFITNLRVAFFRNGFLGDILEEIPLGNITKTKRRSRFHQRIIIIDSKHSSLEFEVYGSKNEQLLISHLTELSY